MEKTTVDKQEFDAAMKKLLASAPVPKKTIAAKMADRRTEQQTHRESERSQ